MADKKLCPCGKEIDEEECLCTECWKEKMSGEGHEVKTEEKEEA